MEINIKKVMTLDLYKILDIDEDATDSDVSNIVLSSSTLELELDSSVDPSGVKTLRTRDTSDPRHFGPKTLRHHGDGSEMSGHFEVSACN